uniref:Retrovirus-related Pol polyprotein from transposon TNT 1-94 n=1 Tax=Cajanus cajan TaxID=3821 RepID=A0A151S3Z3_CAJCA|nr:Retrovirus-related Pol polyprotein from transposon TNT 1-94 [Cajanus cajan]
MYNPGKEHWQMMKPIFRYLKGMFDIGLIYSSHTSCALTTFLDFDYVADLDRISFVIGHAFTIGNSLVSWKTTLDSTIALSRTKVEYMALAEATKKGIRMKGLISDIGFS